MKEVSYKMCIETNWTPPIRLLQKQRIEVSDDGAVKFSYILNKLLTRYCEITTMFDLDVVFLVSLYAYNVLEIQLYIAIRFEINVPNWI